MIELRCLTHLHGKVDPHITYEVKCQWCTRKLNRPVFHQWTIEQIQDAQRRGIAVVYPLLRNNQPEHPGDQDADGGRSKHARRGDVLQ